MIFLFFMFRFCVGVLDVIIIAATTFSFAAWYVLWVGMWLSFCCFDLAPLVLKLCCSKPHNSSKCVIYFQFYGPFLWGSFRRNIACIISIFAPLYIFCFEMWFTFGCFHLAPLVLKFCGSKPHTNWNINNYYHWYIRWLRRTGLSRLDTTRR